MLAAVINADGVFIPTWATAIIVIPVFAWLAHSHIKKITDSISANTTRNEELALRVANVEREYATRQEVRELVSEFRDQVKQLIDKQNEAAARVNETMADLKATMAQMGATLTHLDTEFRDSRVASA